MARKFKITEEQYNMALDEGLTVQADTSSTGGDIKQAYDKAKSQLDKAGVKNGNISFSTSNESKVITKKQIMEHKQNVLKANSNVYTKNDFIKQLIKK